MTPPTGAGSILPAAPVPLREVIGGFEVLGKLGAGGMGTVYRARQVSLGRLVALKILPPQFIEDAVSVARFQREARVAAGLRHANLVQVYAAGEAEGCHYIAMELIDGEDLGKRLKRTGALRAPKALRICVDVARALQHAWQSAHLIHRDIKPGNIFLAANGGVKLGDLGLAKSMLGNTSGLTHTGTMMGTPHYISPEQARGDKEVDFRTDIYSLGCTLFQMLTGQVPYGGRDAITIIRQHLDAPLPAILKVWPQCPIALARLVGRMLKKSRHERHASYEELIGQIESVWAQIDPVGFDPDAFAPPVGTTRRAVQGEDEEIGGGGERGALSLPAAARSKVLIYGGITAAVVVLGVVAWLAWPEPVKLRQVQIAVAPPAAEQRASALETAGARRTSAAPISGGSGGDQASPSKGSLAGATKDAPFVNSLGMKFVPVPIIGGPSAGQQVFFSVWETRVQDYAIFAEETKHEWPKVTLAQGPTQPAVNVSWDDAKAFCDWLTERDRKAGRLGANETYRLPSDHEWSCAMGIAGQEDAAELPQEKDRKIPGVYPWGKGWPPPPGAGNYAGEELEPALAVGKYSWLKSVLRGYRDGFIETAPVGSFAANRFALYDLGGNTWEWCEDWSDERRENRVLRGASWAYPGRGELSAAARIRNIPRRRGSDYGFRCVVAASAPPAAVAPTPAKAGGIEYGEIEAAGAGLDAAFVREIAALPAEQQVQRVVAELKKLNPGYDGKETHSATKEGKVTILRLSPEGLSPVTDLSPVAALKDLLHFSLGSGGYSETGSCPLTDLTPLRAVQLRSLGITHTKVSDLSPLRGMPLEQLQFATTKVSDLAPLEGMPLKGLTIYNTKVASLAPLRGMPLEVLSAAGTLISDISVLAAMPLTVLTINWTLVSDLSPVRGKKLVRLACDHSKVTDLSVLQGMPLKDLNCDFKSERDTAILRSIQTLEKINDLPAAEFWKRVDAGEAPQAK